MKPIYDYIDYLRYLKDHFQLLKKDNKNTSHRSIASKLGYKSSAALSRLFNGKIKLSSFHIEKFVKIYKLPKKEAEYFGIIFGLKQFSSITEKIIHLDELTTFLKSNSKLITEDRCRLYLKYFYYPIISQISIDRLNKSYDLLTSYLNDSKRDIRNTEDTALRKYFIDLLSIAGRMVESKKDELEIMSFDISASSDKINLIREEIINLAYRINEITKSKDKGAKNYQVNFQLLPIEHSTRPKEKPKK